MKTYEATKGNAGLIETRKAQQTKRLVSIYIAEAAGIDAGDCKYVCVCETHATLLNAETLTYARYHAAAPISWCEECYSDFTAGFFGGKE